MTYKKLKEYLNTFQNDAPVRFILASKSEEGKDMDAEMVTACEKDREPVDESNEITSKKLK